VAFGLLKGAGRLENQRSRLENQRSKVALDTLWGVSWL
jgi:hypothetical protein